MFSWSRSWSLPGKTGKGSFMVKSNFAKYLINIYHLFNIIVPKPCRIVDKYLPFIQYYFAKTLSNLCQIFNKNLIQQLTQYNSGRKIYFRENSNNQLLHCIKPNHIIATIFQHYLGNASERCGGYLWNQLEDIKYSWCCGQEDLARILRFISALFSE